MKSKLLRKELIEAREYQLKIAEKAKRQNTLVVLPTGMGKTIIAVLVGVHRLEKFPDGKILIMAPTRPLNAQHKKTFEKFTRIKPEDIVLITGKIKPKERKKMYQKAKVITATPQCIKNDLEKGRLSLEDFSFITFDEAHRCVKDYAYTFIAKKYMEQAKNPLILGLTASPGGTYERIDEIKRNLFIKAVEIRTELDKDVKPWVKPVKREWIYVEFPPEFKKIKVLLEEKFKESLIWLKEHGFLHSSRITKKNLLALQERLSTKMLEAGRDYSLMWAMIRIAEAIKIEHALELLETQGISALHEYLKKLEKSRRRTDKELFKDPRVREAFRTVEEMHEKGFEHPKLEKLKNIVKDLVREKEVKIMIFANYRDTVEKIKNMLNEEGISTEILIGQAIKKGKGLSQKKQLEILRRFKSGEFPVLCGTQIIEEGIDVPAVNYAIFYEAVPSEIRAIQRRGRVGRQMFGKVIFLLTKGTRDEAYYWAAFHKERKMKGILYDLKERTSKKTLLDWLK